MAPDTPSDAPILAVENLVTAFRTGGGWHPAVRDVSFAVNRNANNQAGGNPAPAARNAHSHGHAGAQTLRAQEFDEAKIGM